MARQARRVPRSRAREEALAAAAAHAQSYDEIVRLRSMNETVRGIRSMADGVRARMGSTVGVSVTGIAGPTGGTPDKPVGLVHLCAGDGDRALHRRVVLGGGRDAVRRRAVVVALHLVRELLG